MTRHAPEGWLVFSFPIPVYEGEDRDSIVTAYVDWLREQDSLLDRVAATFHPGPQPPAVVAVPDPSSPPASDTVPKTPTGGNSPASHCPGDVDGSGIAATDQVWPESATERRAVSQREADWEQTGRRQRDF